MQLAQAIDAWEDAHLASLSASTRRDIGAIRSAVVDAGHGDVSPGDVDAEVRQEITVAAVEACSLSEQAIGEFLNVVLGWAKTHRPRRSTNGPRLGAFQTHIALVDDDPGFGDEGHDHGRDDDDWDDWDDADDTDDLEDDDDWDDADDDDDDDDWDDADDDADWDDDDLEDDDADDDDDDDDWDDDLEDDDADDDDDDDWDDDDLDDDDADDDEDWDDDADDDGDWDDDLEDEDTDGTEDKKVPVWSDDDDRPAKDRDDEAPSGGDPEVDERDGLVATFDPDDLDDEIPAQGTDPSLADAAPPPDDGDELDDVVIGDGEIADDDDWLGYLAAAAEDGSGQVIPAENEPSIPPAEKAAASSFFQAIESSPVGSTDAVMIDGEIAPEPAAGGAFSAAADGSKARGSIDWITVAYFTVAAICFALVIILYLQS